MVEEKSFVLHRCWTDLKNKEKCKNRDGLEMIKKAMKATVSAIKLEDELSSEETPNSVARTKYS
jgi:uncharacterized protein YnzC (UPF0291/DUF896 family)